MKKILIFFLILIVITAAIGFSIFSKRDELLTAKIEKELGNLIGARVTLVGLRSQPMWPQCEVKIDSLSITSASDAAHPRMALLEDIQVLLNAPALLAGNWSIESISANLKEVYAVKMDNGDINWAQLKPFEAETLNQMAASPISANFYINRMTLTYGMLYFYDSAAAENSEPEMIDLQGEQEVYDRLHQPHLLIYAPILKIIWKMDKGGLGIPRGRLQEIIAKSTQENKS